MTNEIQPTSTVSGTRTKLKCPGTNDLTETKWGQENWHVWQEWGINRTR